MIIEDLGVGRPKTPAAYIREAKEKYTRRVNSYASRGSSPLRTASSGRRRREKSQEISVREESRSGQVNVIPDWVREREGFGQYYDRVKVTRLADMEAIGRKDASSRSEAEKLSLYRWASHCPVLAPHPHELLDRLQTLILSEPFKEPESQFVVLRGSFQYQTSEKQWKTIETGSWTEGFSDIVGRPIEECAVLRLKQMDVDQVSMSLFAKEQRSCFQFLSEAHYFDLLPTLKLQRLSRAAERVSYEKGATIYQQGSASGAFYVVREGEVALQLPVSVGQGYRFPIGRHAWEVNKLDIVYNLTLKSCIPGIFFGERELLPYSKRITLAKALVPSVCYVVARDKFLEVFTPKEVADLQLHGNLRIPSESECSHQVLQHFQAHKRHQRALEQCSSADHSFSEVRDTLLDRPTRKMQGWIESLRRRGKQAEEHVKRDVVRMQKDKVVVRSADLLHLAERVE
jgi:CRP-like cAMP-binding protein